MPRSGGELDSWMDQLNAKRDASSRSRQSTGQLRTRRSRSLIHSPMRLAATPTCRARWPRRWWPRLLTCSRRRRTF